MIKVLFFAGLRERLNCDQWQFIPEAPLTIAQLKETLATQNPDWRQWLFDGDLLSAVNQQLCGKEQQVQSGDEVAFFPPVTGG